jgi:tripartite-type tricarboxylate transporter receptor subunit TctC
MTHVPYRGNGPGLTDVVAGHIQIMFDQIASASEHAKSGSVRPLAVTTKQRLSFLPNVPTAAEAGYPQLMGTSWTALMAPKGTPPEIIAVLGRAGRNRRRTGDKSEDRGARRQYSGKHATGSRGDHRS